MQFCCRCSAAAAAPISPCRSFGCCLLGRSPPPLLLLLPFTSVFKSLRENTSLLNALSEHTVLRVIVRRCCSSFAVRLGRFSLAFGLLASSRLTSPHVTSHRKQIYAEVQRSLQMLHEVDNVLEHLALFWANSEVGGIGALS